MRRSHRNISPDGKYLATGGQDRTVRLWNLSQVNQAPVILHGSQSTVRAVAFNKDGTTLAAAGGDRLIVAGQVADYRVRVWDLTRNDPRLRLWGNAEIVFTDLL